MLIQAAMIEAVQIVDRLCSIDVVLVPRLLPEIKRLLSGKTPAEPLLQVGTAACSVTRAVTRAVPSAVPSAVTPDKPLLQAVLQAVLQACAVACDVACAVQCSAVPVLCPC